MNWEENWQNYQNRTLEEVYTEKYGETIGPWLAEYEERDLDGQGSWRAKLNYEMLQEFFRSFREDVPRWIQEDYVKGQNRHKDYILENLKSHDWEGMWKTMQRFFGPNAGWMEPREDGELTIVRWMPKGAPNLDLGKLLRDIRDENSEIGKGFKNILKFYGYFISGIKTGGWFTSVILEPEYPNSASRFVYEDCKGIAYSVASYENVPSILAKGLRIRNGDIHWWSKLFKKKYGRYPNREEKEKFEK